jgi:two-component system, OmpR family, KDP operon response regulator KdpE
VKVSADSGRVHGVSVMQGFGSVIARSQIRVSTDRARTPCRKHSAGAFTRKNHVSQGMPRILLLSDHAPTRLYLRSHLAIEFQVIEADTLKNAADDLKSCRAEGVLVAWEARGTQSASFIAEVRAFSRVPILYLAGQTEGDACVAVLDAGADDFTSLPCGAGELRARSRSAQRRYARGDHQPVLKLGSLTLNPVRRTVSRGERNARLTALEYRLFEALARSAPGMAVSAGELLRRVWGRRTPTGILGDCARA